MSHVLFSTVGMFGASSFHLVDWTIKGTALLMLAAIAATMLRRDSAAARHLVWLLALIAMLMVPVLSAMLPQWRVLPEWTRTASKSPPISATAQPVDRPAMGQIEIPRNGVRSDVEPAPALQPTAAATEPPPVGSTPVSRPQVVVAKSTWSQALPLVWGLGFGALVLRLLAARWALWSAGRRGAVLGCDDPVAQALKAGCVQLGIRRPVTVMIHHDRTIPIVWGLWRSRLLLPSAARDWNGEQLRSVLLHELAHIKRWDMLGLLLAQMVCALHWFNPLVWLAAWRLGVERERACDDLVLAGGVRASAYAGHLLEIVTQLTPAKSMQACGLAMARKSSLEGRIIAVLSASLNRRRVSAALATLLVAIGIGLAAPMAMLRAADETPGETPKPAPADGAKRNSGAQEALKWGEPVHGLRAALVIRYSTEKPAPGDFPDLYLAVRNVSDLPIRLTDSQAPMKANSRILYLKQDGKIMAGLGAREPSWGDIKLQPQEVAFLPVFDPANKLNVAADPTLDKHTIGSHLAEDALKDAHQTLFAEIQIADAPADAWTGKLRTGETSGADAAGYPKPKDKDAQALYKMWHDHARANGNFPGGLVGRLGEKIKEFIRFNTGDVSGDPYAKKMAPLLPRIDASRDWKPQEVIALMDDIAAVTPVPLETMREEIEERTFKTGAPLPKALATAPWGTADASGLRLAWLLEPRAAEQHLGTPLKSRILIHNAGKNVVVFRTRMWHQVRHKATDANGAEIKTESTEWLTRGRLMAYRLWPGEFVEVTGPGIGVGARNNVKEWQNARVGSWVEAKAGDDVTITTAPVPLSDWNEAPAQNDEPRWWLDLIRATLAQDQPIPDDAEERKRLVYRAGMEIFGTPLTAEEINTFVNDRGGDALDSLAKRFAQRAGTTPFSGNLISGPTTFHVLPPDPNAPKPDAPPNPAEVPAGPPPASGRRK
jgi:beta-lactamase regulating signal transducer with metallopeptidase domain